MELGEVQIDPSSRCSFLSSIKKHSAKFVLLYRGIEIKLLSVLLIRMIQTRRMRLVGHIAWMGR
jgi:hypothetical protein